jgi:hypothetical protein
MKQLILALLTGAALAAASPALAAVKSVVLVHGAFADGPGWKPVADIPESHGYSAALSRSLRRAPNGFATERRTTPDDDLNLNIGRDC